MEWCTIESDPAVFSELLEKIGVPNVGVEEVFELDDKPYLESLGRIYGFIFLFKYTKHTEQRACLTQFDSDLFYAKQVITNACGTQALLSVALNIPDITLGTELAAFKDFCTALEPEDRGVALAELEIVRDNHNSFARPEQFAVQQTRKAKEGDDVFHFIAYVPFKKQVYELDGLQKGPILLGEESSERSWIDIASEEIKKRMRQYQDKEIRFTLLAVNRSRELTITEEIQRLQRQKGEAYKALEAASGAGFDKSQFTDFDRCVELAAVGGEAAMKAELPSSSEELTSLVQQLAAEVTIQEESLAEVSATKKSQKLENERRKFNYVPLILQLLKLSSEKGELAQQYEKAVHAFKNPAPATAK